MNTKKRLLIVDDQVEFLDILSSMASKNWEVTTANGVKEAVSILFKEKFDVVITDFEMPDGDGDDVLAAVGDIQGDKPIVFLHSSNLHKAKGTFKVKFDKGAKEMKEMLKTGVLV